MGWLCLISQPLVITFSVGFWILYNRQSIFNADRITQLPNRFGTAPKVTELPVTVRINRRPDDVIMDMGFINMRADHKGVITLGEPFGKFYTQSVGFFRCDLSRLKRLANMISDHIICSSRPSGGSNVLALCQQKLCVSSPAVTLISCDESAVVCLLRICCIVNDVADCLAFCTAFASMQRHDACGCHSNSPLEMFFLNSLLLSLK